MQTVAPIRYTYLAAAQVGTIMKSEDASSIQGGGHMLVENIPVPELPWLHNNVRSTMFFC